MHRDLILFRHGTAAGATWDKPDIDRPLTEEGRLLVARQITQSGLTEVDGICCSPALRTRQTLEIILNYFIAHPQPLILPEIYEASDRTLLSIINHTEESIRKLLIIGHNPGLTYLANHLYSGSVLSMAPGGLVHLQFDNGSSWHEVSGNMANLIQVL